MARITIEKASKMLNMSPMCLRVALRQNKFNQFGEAWKNKEKWTYYINAERLEQYLNAKGVNDELSVRA